MMAGLKILDTVWNRVLSHISEAPSEGFAFLLCRWEPTSSGPALVAEDAVLIDHEDVLRDGPGWSLTDRAIDLAINRAARSGRALVEVHSHPLGPPGFSDTDREGLRPFAQYVLESLPNRPYGATVWTDRHIYGELYSHVGEQLRNSVLRITIVGRQLRLASPGPSFAIPPRFRRQAAWFGDEVQRILAQLRVGVVGLSGTGSHVVQGLALLGVNDYVLVDSDKVAQENLNRMPIATAADIGLPKTLVARRFITGLAREATVRSVTGAVGSHPEAERALASVDIMFGCVDNDGPRLLMNRLAVAHAIPYFDVATGIYPIEHGYAAGGRLALTLPGHACLACTDELDLEEVRTYFTSDEELCRQLALGYVQDRPGESPSVGSLNGVIAHSALNELLMLVSRDRDVTLRVDFDLMGDDKANRGPYLLPRRNVVPRSGCVECALPLTGAA